jgi:hypothetical protein
MEAAQLAQAETEAEAEDLRQAAIVRQGKGARSPAQSSLEGAFTALWKLRASRCHHTTNAVRPAFRYRRLALAMFSGTHARERRRATPLTLCAYHHARSPVPDRASECMLADRSPFPLENGPIRKTKWDPVRCVSILPLALTKSPKNQKAGSV